VSAIAATTAFARAVDECGLPAADGRAQADGAWCRPLILTSPAEISLIGVWWLGRVARERSLVPTHGVQSPRHSGPISGAPPGAGNKEEVR